MPRLSTVATHPQIKAIIAEIVKGATSREIARKFGVHEDAVGRYRNSIEERAKRAAAMVDNPVQTVGASRFELERAGHDAIAANTLVAETQRIRSRLWNIADRARNTEDLGAEVKAIGQLPAAVRLEAELTGQLQQAAQVTYNQMFIDADVVRQIAAAPVEPSGPAAAAEPLELAPSDVEFGDPGVS